MNFKIITLFIVTVFLNCKTVTPKKFESNNENFQYSGRHEQLKGEAALISPGASVAINFSGQTCKIYLKAEKEPYNYVSLELDGSYIGRLKISSEITKEYTVNVTSKEKTHSLKIIKESEASCGAILFQSIKVENVLEKSKKQKYTIEFIGDSITCGAAADSSVFPCNEGGYFDHENAYYSYGACTARALNADFTLSSVSGIGMYRNWNDENIEEPIMPQVYENLYLDTNTSKKNNFTHAPEIITIALGTNDLSTGDGTKPRLPFNKEIYISNYIQFIKTIQNYYSNSRIVLLTSPMVIGENNTLLVSCLEEVQSYFLKNFNKSILLFQFNKQYTNGCSWHPSVEEHKEMAKKLTSFLKNILNS
ncbi:GDSL-type esterase/lipase family protein [Thalassobellus citreus]|uniref:SGNH/GDSL hydrolase family protein n=1 Tax=Thalassobellus citreus TaxID=3367752 RepID=UPI0037B03494